MAGRDSTMMASQNSWESMNTVYAGDGETSYEATQSLDAVQVNGHVRQAWYQWFSPADSPSERRLIMKLDVTILVWLFLAHWVKVLDSSAAGTAYVSGMKEDLRMFGNELNYQQTFYMIGFITCQIPFTMIMTRIPVNYTLPIVDIIWGAITLGIYKISSVKQLYALRFFIGAFGGFFFPAVQWYLGSWYKRSELSRRSALFFVASRVGSMTSGYVQAGAYSRLNGVHGIAGWRWLHIICFAVTVPVALLGFLILPGIPEKCTSRFLTSKEIALAKARMKSQDNASTAKLDIAVFKRILTRWRLWILVLFAFFFSQADGISYMNGLPLWLKEEGYSVKSINTISTVVPAVAIAFSLIWAVLADAYNLKVTLIFITAALNMTAGIILAVWSVPKGLKLFAFFLSGTANSIAAIVYSWANEICAKDSEERAFVLSSMNTIGNTFDAWIPLFVWKTTDAPRYLIGYSWTVALDFCMLLMTFVVLYFWKRDKLTVSTEHHE